MVEGCFVVLVVGCFVKRREEVVDYFVASCPAMVNYSCGGVWEEDHFVTNSFGELVAVGLVATLVLVA